jgi:DNA-binding NarL/FixJ family response regulator
VARRGIGACTAQRAVPMSGEAIRVLVVDDHPVFAEALALAIEASPRLSCVGVAADAVGALQMADEVTADVIVMDAQLRDEDGIDTARSCLQDHPDARVLVLSEHQPSASLVRAALDAGASALLPKTTSLGVVVDTIPSLTEHCFTTDRHTVAMLCGPVPARRPTSRDDPAGDTLTRRERDILGLLVSGIDLQTASLRLGISVNTTRGYVKNLYRKLGVHNQLQLLAVARQRGLFEE